MLSGTTGGHGGNFHGDGDGLLTVVDVGGVKSMSASKTSKTWTGSTVSWRPGLRPTSNRSGVQGTQTGCRVVRDGPRTELMRPLLSFLVFMIFLVTCA